MGYLKKNNLITEDEFYILSTLEDNGYQARIVGGAVRNFLLNKDIKDIDIATSATFQQIVSAFKNTRLPIIPIGEKYGTVMIRYHNKSYEITTLREDIQTFGRQAEVKFTTSFEIDSSRRDFTINALYMDKNGELYDYHNGLRDISLKNVRFIGDALTRMQEDYLRVFRYFRFVSQYGEYKFNKDYLEIIDQLKKHLLSLSSERIFNELINIFSDSDSYRVVNPMLQVLKTLFATYADPLTTCHDIGIFHELSPIERLCMLLKFSDPNQVLKFKLTKHIKSTINLKETDITNLKHQLKLTAVDLQKFYLRYVAVKNLMNQTITRATSERLIKELDLYIDNKMALFQLRAHHLEHLNLSQQQLTETMILTKNFWHTHDNATLDDCVNFATKNAHTLSRN